MQAFNKEVQGNLRRADVAYHWQEHLALRLRYHNDPREFGRNLAQESGCLVVGNCASVQSALEATLRKAFSQALRQQASQGLREKTSVKTHDC
eukprot:1138309-Pelagomonas_calceolata.AAC.1